MHEPPTCAGRCRACTRALWVRTAHAGLEERHRLGLRHAPMHVCMYACIYVHVRMYACTHVRMYACTHACTCVCTYARMHGVALHAWCGLACMVCMHVRVHGVAMHACMYMHGVALESRRLGLRHPPP